MKKEVTVSFPYIGLLGVMFVGLKLTGYIDWSWWWVTAPFWFGLAFTLAVALVIGLVAGVAAVLDRVARR